MKKILALSILFFASSIFALTQGNITVGTGGNIASILALHDSIEGQNFTGDINCTLIAPLTSANYVWTYNPNGHGLHFYDRKQHNGCLDSGNIITFSTGGDAHGWLLNQGGGTAGKTGFHGINFKDVGNRSAGYSFIGFYDPATDGGDSCIMDRCIINSNGSNGNGVLVISTSTTKLKGYIVNNKFCYSVGTCLNLYGGIAAPYAFTVENNTLVGGSTGIDNSQNSVVLALRNNLCIGQTTCYTNTAFITTFSSCASSDNTGSAANIRGMTYDIFTDTSAAALDQYELVSGTVIADSGEAPTISQEDILGNPRKHVIAGTDSGYSIGAYEIYVPPPSDAIRIVSMDSNRVFQRDSHDSGTITISGSFDNGNYTLTSIQYQVLQFGTSTVVKNWTKLCDTSSDTTFSATAKIYKNKNWLSIRVRGMAGSTAVDTATDTIPWGVGDVYLVGGQSQVQQAGIDSLNGYTASNGFIVDYNDSVWTKHEDSTDALGVHASIFPSLGNRLYSYDSVPICFVNRAISGSLLVYRSLNVVWGVRNAADHDDTAYTYGKLLFQASNALNGALPRGMIWGNGEADMMNSIPRTAYRDTLQLLAGWYREDLNYSTMPVYIIQTGRLPTLATAGAINAIHYAQSDCHNGNTYLSCVTLDLPILGDSVHFTRAGMDSIGLRTGTFINEKKRSPIIRSARYGKDSTVIIISINNSGTTLAPDSAASGFIARQVSDSTLDTPDSVRRSGTSYYLYFTSAHDSIFYGYGTAPATSQAVYNNNSPRQMLEPWGGIAQTSNSGLIIGGGCLILGLGLFFGRRFIKR